MATSDWLQWPAETEGATKKSFSLSFSLQKGKLNIFETKRMERRKNDNNNEQEEEEEEEEEEGKVRKRGKVIREIVPFTSSQQQLVA